MNRVATLMWMPCEREEQRLAGCYQRLNSALSSQGAAISAPAERDAPFPESR